MSQCGFNLCPIFYCVICLFVRVYLEAQLVKYLPANAGDTRDVDLIPGSGRSPGGGKWQLILVLLPGKFHGQRNLVGCSPWGRQGSDTTERLPFHFSLSCIGEGNGNPLQCSCLENPRDGGAWWAAIYGVAKSRTRLKRLSSSSISLCSRIGCTGCHGTQSALGHAACCGAFV